jgi:U3 small nucleolar RNA-associated protein 7
MPVGLSSVTFSERRLLAAACGDSVHIFKDLCRYVSHSLRAFFSFIVYSESPSSTPYLTHSMAGATVSALRFAPFEDVLGVGHARGFTSLLVPGRGAFCVHTLMFA